MSLTPMSGRSFKRQRTRYGAGGYVPAAARSLTYDVPSFRRKFPAGARFGGARYVGGRYVRGSNRRIYRKSSAVELGCLDTDLSVGLVPITTNSNANIVVLNLIQPGNGSWNRHGRKATLKTLRLRGCMTYTNEALVTTYDSNRSICRMVVVWDKNPNSGAIPTWDTIFGETSQTGTEDSTPLSGLKLDNTSRFRVLRDCILEPPTVMPLGAAAQAFVTSYVPFDEFIDLKGLQTVYSGETNPLTIADIASGALYVGWRAANNSSNFDGWTIGAGFANARLRFYP